QTGQEAGAQAAAGYSIVSAVGRLCPGISFWHRQLQEAAANGGQASRLHMTSIRRAAGACWVVDRIPRQQARLFIARRLSLIPARSDKIQALRQTILNLAVRGNLVEQDPNDEPAAKLLKRIAKERAALLDAHYPNPSEAKTQKKKQVQQRLPAKLPKLPYGWSWTTLQQCSLIVIDCKNKTAPYSPSGIKRVRTMNVRNGNAQLERPEVRF
ncbi:MAG TPA: hypothetical protein VK035_04465, partial [Kiloniellales bacterium]|nr:hypothetical protein [Kiloniellales bacterium]